MRGPLEVSSIATARLVLNPLRVEDAEEMVSVLGDPALHEFTGGQPSTLAELQRSFRGVDAGFGFARRAVAQLGRPTPHRRSGDRLHAGHCDDR